MKKFRACSGQIPSLGRGEVAIAAVNLRFRRVEAAC
jgi:hypothetical protein